jgi:hypothetical protein
VPAPARLPYDQSSSLEFEELLELEFDELFELEFEELFELELDELLELEFEELFELEFDELLELEFEEELPAVCHLRRSSLSASWMRAFVVFVAAIPPGACRSSCAPLASEGKP